MSNSIKPITSEEGVILRDFLKSFGRDRINELLYAGRPESLTRDELMKNDAESISRAASMHAGYDAAVEHFFNLSSVRPRPDNSSGHEDMT
jgi:hypothetical protein